MGDLYFFGVSSVQVSSVAQSCPTLCDPVNRSTPGLPVHHQLPEFTQFISVFWWSHVCPLFWGLCSLALVSVQLKEHHWADSRAGRLVQPVWEGPELNQGPLPGGRASLRVPEWAELLPVCRAERPCPWPSVRLRGQGPRQTAADRSCEGLGPAHGAASWSAATLRATSLLLGAVGVSPARPPPPQLGGPALSYKDCFRVSFWVRIGGPPSRDIVRKSPAGSLGHGPAAGSQSSHPGASVHGGLRDCCC